MNAGEPPVSPATSVPASLQEPKADHAPARWRRAELLTAVFLTFWIAVLHLVYLFHAGPLWRDECGTMGFAAMPTLGEIWRNLRYDNFPPLFVAVARVWTLAGLHSDFGYRLLGFLIGMSTLGVFWYCARKLGGTAPLLILALYGANPLAIRVGDALRPYGLGIALVLLTSVLVWDFVQTPGKRTLFWAAMAATLSVQCLYQNALFIMAFSCGAWVVTLSRREWKTTLQTGMIGLVAAASLLPYWGIIEQGREWADITVVKTHNDAILGALVTALQTPGRWMSPVWLALCLAATAVVVRCGMRQRRRVMVYCGTNLVVIVAFYLIFLRALNLKMSPWYFLVLMAPAALMMDTILDGADPWRSLIARAFPSCIVISACSLNCYLGVCVRQSNVDLVAAKLKEAAKPGDLILVFPWYYGVSLQHYLDSSQWTTVPPLAEIRIHRYDLMKQAMMTKNPIGPLLEEARVALRSGHKLWLVGDSPDPPGGGKPQPVYPPYKGNLENAGFLYTFSWMCQIINLVSAHATAGGMVDVPVPSGMAVNPDENITFQVVQGWRE
ncbi:MAG: hypothetical protein ACLQU4_09960 [Limisphaerales bacterium]